MTSIIESSRRSPRQDLSIRVLIVEDSENDALFLLRELKKLVPQVQSHRVETAEGFVMALEEQEWDVILCDYNLPTFGAPEALAILREHQRETPAIIVSGYVGEEAAVAAMKAGARDYVSKDHLTRLGPAVLRELEEAETRRRHRHLEMELRQSQKLESIGRLAGGLAHDFNNLLTVIQGFAELGVRHNQSGDKTVTTYFDQIVDAAKSASRLTSQLLTFSRRQPVNLEVVNLNELIMNMERMLGRLVPEDVVLATNLSPDVRPVKVDRHQMEQVVINMVVNARDAMPKGGTITLETSSALSPLEIAGDDQDIPRECARLSVVDTGTGMTEEVKARLFEPFFTTKEAGKGSGLGLATCYGIVKQSGGEITALSEPGVGTRFDIWLPNTVEPVAPAEPVERSGQEPPRGEETVLVVEDQESVRNLAVTVLQEQGYRVLQAADGVEALKVAEELGVWQVQMLVTDVIMPRMGGVELAEQLRERHPHMLVMFVSGYARDLLDYQSTNDFWFMQKPFSPWELAENVRRALDSRTGAPATAETGAYA